MDRSGDGAKTGVLVAAEGHAWETAALGAIDAARDLVTLRRCLDQTDLLAVAAAGAARVAVVATTPGLDHDLVERLTAHQVATVAVVPGRGTATDPEEETARLRRIGVGAVVPADQVGTALVDEVRAVLAGPVEPVDQHPSAPAAETPASRGEVVAVWGPTGAPGRTTVAVGLASAAAAAGCETLLLDTDPYGGAVAQHLGVLDESSGLLAAARHANSGTLTPDRLRASARRVGDRLDVLTGLPRPDRWTEVRARTLDEVVHRAAEAAPRVVLDVGFGAEARAQGAVPSPRSRDALVTSAVQAADALVVVGAAEPVGLTRLARLLVDGRQVRAEGPDHVVVNRMRPGLGWRDGEIADMVSRVCPRAEVHFLPFDLDAADRAMQEGRSPVEGGPSRLRSSLLRLALAVTGAPVEDARGRTLLSRASR